LSLHIEFEQRKNALIVRLKGELDHHTAESVKIKMEEAILRDEVKYFILNLKQLTFMDSSGLGVILGRYKQILSRGGKMIVCELTPAVYRLFELSGLFKIISIQDNENVAIANLEVAP
jgi:stage II sporulation protein AA (anti-sigma F factor antagonist)